MDLPIPLHCMAYPGRPLGPVMGMGFTDAQPAAASAKIMAIRFTGELLFDANWEPTAELQAKQETKPKVFVATSSL